MTTTSSHRSSPSAPRVPAWAAILIIVLCLVGGGWFVWRYWMDGGPTKTVFGQGDPPIVGRNVEQLGDGVFRQQGSQWLVRAGDAQIRVNAPEGGETRFSFFYTTSLGISETDEIYLNPRGHVELTREQRRQFRELGFPGTMTVDDADKAKIASLWAANVKSPSDRAHADLVEALMQIADKSRQATIDANQALVARAKAILTPEQLKQLEAK